MSAPDQPMMSCVECPWQGDSELDAVQHEHAKHGGAQTVWVTRRVAAPAIEPEP